MLDLDSVRSYDPFMRMRGKEGKLPVVYATDRRQGVSVIFATGHQLLADVSNGVQFKGGLRVELGVA